MVSTNKANPIPLFTPGQPIIQVAYAYADNGWRIFPRYATADPKTGKVKQHPLTTHDFKDATNDLRQIEYGWSKKWKRPDAMINASTGIMNDILVLEIDMKNGKNGLAELEELKAGRELPITLSATSPTGGKHFFFNYKDGIRIGHLTPGVEFKGEGGAITLPPSRRPDGEYLWDDPSVKIADPPDWLVDLCRAKGGKVKIGDKSPPPEWLVAEYKLDQGKGLSTDPADLPEPVTVEKVRVALS